MGDEGSDEELAKYFGAMHMPGGPAAAPVPRPAAPVPRRHVPAVPIVAPVPVYRAPRRQGVKRKVDRMISGNGLRGSAATEKVDYDDLVIGQEYFAVANEDEAVQGNYRVKIVAKPNANHITLRFLSISGPEIEGVQYVVNMPRAFAVRSTNFRFYELKGATKKVDYDDLVIGQEYLAVANEDEAVQGNYRVIIVAKSNANYITLRFLSISGPKRKDVEYVVNMPRAFAVRKTNFRYYALEGGAKPKVCKKCGGYK